MEHANDKRDRVLKAALEHQSELIAYAQSLLGSHAAAEDAVQEVLLVVVRKYDEFQEGTSILAWSRAIVRLEVLRAKQRRSRERTLAERMLDDAIDAAFEEYQSLHRRDEAEIGHRAIQNCLERLSERAREVLHSRFVDELSYQQISDRVGISLEGVRKTLFRNKRNLRDCVETRMRAAQ